MIRAFVFDLDGTLVETERRSFGRTAEQIVYGTRTTGVENDIEQAARLSALSSRILAPRMRSSGIGPAAPTIASL